MTRESAAIFDPRADVEIYVEMAREAGLAITHIFETHIHADLVSGSRELCARLESAKIYSSGEGGAEYGFGPEKIKDGDRFTFGEVLVTARHTPGHTPEHMSYLLSETDHPEEPWAVLTGDSLFVSSAGRPDLLGEKHTKQLAEQQFHTLRDFYLKLPDHVMIYPNHGAGSPCGADIGARLSSTIGYERKFNKFLQFADAKSFTDLRDHDCASGAALLSAHEESERGGAKSAREPPTRSRSSTQGIQGSNREEGWCARRRTHDACVWRRSYFRRAQHRRHTNSLHLGGLDA